MDVHQFFVHVPATMLRQHLPVISKLPVGLEILVDHETLAPGFRPELERLAAELRALGRPVKFHAPFRDLAPGGHDPEAVALARRRLVAALELAPLFGASCVVAHTAWDPGSYELESTGWLDRSAAFWGGRAADAERCGVSIALENVFDRDPDILAELLGRLPAARFGANFDTGHWHAYSHAPLSAWFESLEGRILSLHVHDNQGQADEHLALGSGTFPWREFYALVRGLERPFEWTVENRNLADLLASASHLGRHSGIPEFAFLAALAGGCEDAAPDPSRAP